MEKYKAVGLMSGTSLDGLDIAACEFTRQEGNWTYRILHCQTIPYTNEWKEKLAGLPECNALAFAFTHVEYGHLLGNLTRSFLERTGFRPDLIASHGHTVFHQPDRGLTVQVGDGSAIAAETGIPVVCDFRSLDVALGGQGAPLVPVGDRYLFGEYDACLNLGGFANISMEWNGSRIAFDICPVNIILNKIAAQLGLEYDHDGGIARTGSVVPSLLEELNNLEYYKKQGPKSLGREWLECHFLPLLHKKTCPQKDILRTLCEHAAHQINRSVSDRDQASILVTGGGTHNLFLMECIRGSGPYKWISAPHELSDFKEALVFAFLGVLRFLGETNVLASVTGGRQNHSGGAAFHLLE
ncbi:MAG: anhydro-N-acetylmuramic acid kinase [Bacteroidales bacterium]|jgi:anhydro-N-acetylmuramic acid kinase|nr:anhydro-N-acetylmuramic acid kinase [Bacteroidales bacterium]